LIGDAADQVVRADNYIRSTDVPTFQVESGGTITLDKAKYSERVLLTVTLDVLDIFTSDMYQMRDIGVVTTHDLPWCVALTDLRAISEILLRPIEFTHYLRWRMSTIADSRLHAGKDELNWLAVYLKEGPARPSVPGDFTDLSFTSYTDDFDAFFLYKEGARTIPAPRPAQPVPRPLDTLLDRLTQEGMHGFTEPGELLLNMNFDERRRFAQCLVELEFNQKRAGYNNFVFQSDSFAAKVLTGDLATTEISSEAAALSKLSGKRTLVMSVSVEPYWDVRAWAVSG
jgi:hypothetical protein